MEREGREVTLRPKELVIALGVSGYPNVPRIAGAETLMTMRVERMVTQMACHWVVQKASQIACRWVVRMATQMAEMRVG